MQHEVNEMPIMSTFLHEYFHTFVNKLKAWANNGVLHSKNIYSPFKFSWFRFVLSSFPKPNQRQ